MNLKSRSFTIRRCVVCGYQFSDRHHVYPKALMGSWRNKAVMHLCPNHHRYANMIQAMLQNRETIESVEGFAAEYFDADFNTKVLRQLTRQYETVDGLIRENAYSIFEMLFGGFDDRTE